MALENEGRMFGDCGVFWRMWRADRVSSRATRHGNREAIPRVETTLQFPED